VSIGGILAFAAALGLGGAIVMVILWQLFNVFAAREVKAGAMLRNPTEADAMSRTPEPRLQSHPKEDLLALRAREDAVLNSYGWVDPAAGVIRIPVSEAMKLVAQRGLPARPTAPGSATPNQKDTK
jgi:hypothetical protein